MPPEDKSINEHRAQKNMAATPEQKPAPIVSAIAQRRATDLDLNSAIMRIGMVEQHLMRTPLHWAGETANKQRSKKRPFQGPFYRLQGCQRINLVLVISRIGSDGKRARDLLDTICCGPRFGPESAVGQDRFITGWPASYSKQSSARRSDTEVICHIIRKKKLAQKAA